MQSKKTATYIEETLDWFLTKTGRTGLKMTRETLDGGDFRLSSFRVHPYLRDKLPKSLDQNYFRSLIQVLFNCSTEDFIDACIAYFLGDTYLASEEERMKLMTRIRDYLFQKDRIKPRLIAPDKRRK